MNAGKQAMVALKSAYGGALMFTMLGALMGVRLGPIGIGIGLVMGHKGLKDEKKRQVGQRRAQAKNAMRRYCDEISSSWARTRGTRVRRVQRQLRDHYTVLAEELNRSNRPRSRPRPTPPNAPRPSARSGCATSTPSSPASSSCASARRSSSRRSRGEVNLVERTRGVLARAREVYRGSPEDRAPRRACATGSTSRCGWRSPAGSSRESRRCSTRSSASGWRRPTRASAPRSSPGTGTATPTG